MLQLGEAKFAVEKEILLLLRQNHTHGLGRTARGTVEGHPSKMTVRNCPGGSATSCAGDMHGDTQRQNSNANSKPKKPNVT